EQRASWWFKPFEGNGPEWLHRVHAATIANEGEDLAVRTGERRAHRHRHAIADRPTHILQPFMRRRASGERIEAASRGHRLIDHDGLLGDDVAEDRADLVRIECTRRYNWLEGLL